MRAVQVVSASVGAFILVASCLGCHCCPGLCRLHQCDDDRGCPDQGHRLKKRPSVTARPASPANMGEPCGIPFYLPKPLLVISKNVYHVEEPTIGLTGTAPIPNAFDHQADYATADLDTNVLGSAAQPPASPASPTGDATSSAPHQHSTGAPLAPGVGAVEPDGLTPHMFFTYEIVFVPDLTQKYVLDVEGGAGEIRAAINLVNGWQFTGLGPYYMKDSSTAQNLFARGVQLNLGLQGAADVINSIANLQTKAAAGAPASMSEMASLVHALDKANTQKTFNFEQIDPEHWVDEFVTTETGERIRTGRKVPPSIERYAEIYVYEADLCEGQMVWKPVANHTFSREFLGSLQQEKNPAGAGQMMETLKGIGALPAAAPLTAELPAPVDAALASSIVDKTLTPPPPPCKKGCLGFLGKCRASLVNRIVNVPVPATPAAPTP